MGLLIAFAAYGESNPPNILLICVDDLRPELGCYGVEYIRTPNIDRLAASGRLFRRHYVQAPTCGASRYALLTGRYGPTSNYALFERANQMAENPDSVKPSMPAWFRQHGYTTISVGKVSHHPGGLGGPDWDNEQQPEMPDSWDRNLMPSGPWQHPRGAMHGLASGEIREDPGKMDVFQSEEGPDTLYPDGWILNQAIEQLKTLSHSEAGKPFLLAVGMIRPHLPLGAPQEYYQLYRDATLPPIPHPDKPGGVTTWHPSGEFMRYHRWGKDPNEDSDFADQVRKHYAACVTYADTLVGKLLGTLEESGTGKHTVVILWGDHGWHLGEHAIWGKHSLFEESLRSPLIIRVPDMTRAGEGTEAIVESVDLFPTLCEIAGLPTPDFLHGKTLVPILNDPRQTGHPAYSYQNSRQTLRTDTHRLIVHQDGNVELYDHTIPDGETTNLADRQPESVESIKELLEQRESMRLSSR